ncbi:MAG: amino acid ABC transporter substrate-binding protein [Desulfobacteraceae bacterium]|nr:amino acid ABC transporter substrate-binding protein [Desulfobacteraceae bacterium]
MIMCRQIMLQTVFIFLLIFQFADSLIAEDKNVHLATDPWAPFYGPELKNGGFFTEIVRESFKRSGYKLSVDFVPWKRAVVQSKEGKFDGLLGAFHTKERETFYIYSNPISTSSLVFVTKKERDIKYTTLKDFKNYQIGTIRGYTYSPGFDNAAYLHKQPVQDVRINIKKLLKGRIDIIIDSRAVILNILKKEFPDHIDSLKIIEPPLKVNSLYVPISKRIENAQQIVDALNKGLQAIIEDETYFNILESYGF